MQKLEDFFKDVVSQDEARQVVISDRFKSGNENLLWTIEPISVDENIKIKKRCTRLNSKGDKELDFDDYLCELCVESIKTPNLNNVDLQSSYQVMGSKNLLKEMLNLGEYNFLIEQVQDINGFNKNFDDLVHKAKN